MVILENILYGSWNESSISIVCYQRLKIVKSPQLYEGPSTHRPAMTVLVLNWRGLFNPLPGLVNCDVHGNFAL